MSLNFNMRRDWDEQLRRPGRLAPHRKGRPMFRVVSFTVMIVALTFHPLPAAADARSFPDADDTAGRIDVREARQSHVRVETSDGTQRLIRHDVLTYESWRARSLRAIDLFVNTDDDRSFERRLEVAPDADGNLHGTMTALPSGRVVGYVKVWRPSARRVAVQFPRRALGQSVQAYKWYVVARYHDEPDADCGVTGDVVYVCADRAPDRGTYRHSL